MNFGKSYQKLLKSYFRLISVESVKKSGVGRLEVAGEMAKTVCFKRLILRAVLRQVSPMVIRLFSVSDHMPLLEFHDVFRTILGCNGDLGYIIRVHGQEFNCFRRKTRSKALHEFKLHRQESSSTSATPCICGSGTFASWIFRTGSKATTRRSVWVARRCAPGVLRGPTGYRLMLKRQREGGAMSDPVRLEAGVQMLAEACPGQSERTGVRSAPCWTRAFRASIEDCMNPDLCNLISSV